MSNLKRNLIKILEKNFLHHLCSLSETNASCAGIDCSECPFNDEGSLASLVAELKNNYIYRCRKCGTKFSVTHTNCPSCNALESVRLL